SEFCQAVRRDPLTGEIRDPYAVQIRNANTGALRTSGVDLALQYAMPLHFGLFGPDSTLDIATNWTYVDQFTLTPLSALPDIKNRCVGSFGSPCGEPLPRWRGNTRITWKTGGLVLSVRHRFIDSVVNDRFVLPSTAGATNVPPLGTLVYPVLPDQNYFDLSF